MISDTKSNGEFQAGKAAGAAELRFRIAGAGVRYLEGALQNPVFGEEHVLPVLSNPSLPSSLIQKIAAHKQWLSRYEIQRDIVVHRNSPMALKLNLVHFLRWKDLVKVAEDPFSPPPVKKKAETVLKSKVEEMALGERIALARLAGPGIISLLRDDAHQEVITALLGNPRLVEDEVVALCSEERAPAPVLAAVGSHPRWRDRHAVRMSLLRHPTTPPGVSLRFLEWISPGELAEIASSPVVPRLVRATARQLLQSRRATVDRNRVVS
jgi:hypothetical protein